MKRMYWNRVLIGIVAAVGMIAATGPLAAASTYDPNDPYQSGCSNGSYVAASGVIDFNNDSSELMMHIQNWYSPSCKKNWVLAWWNGIGWQDLNEVQINIHTKGLPYTTPAGAHHQCFPASCDPVDFYNGQNSPAWSDMVEGTDVACVRAGAGNVSGDFFSTGSVVGSGYDQICA